jgi:hypothetical protein
MKKLVPAQKHISRHSGIIADEDSPLSVAQALLPVLKNEGFTLRAEGPLRLSLR